MRFACNRFHRWETLSWRQTLFRNFCNNACNYFRFNAQSRYMYPLKLPFEIAHILTQFGRVAQYAQIHHTHLIFIFIAAFARFPFSSFSCVYACTICFKNVEKIQIQIEITENLIVPYERTRTRGMNVTIFSSLLFCFVFFIPLSI